MNKKKIFIRITIGLTFAEVFIALYFHLFETIPTRVQQALGNNKEIFQFLAKATPVGIVCFINYYVISPIVFNVIRFIWRITGHYKYIIRMITPIISNAVDWLISCTHHWGVDSMADQCQNANTCEALIALYKSSFSNSKCDIYRDAFQNVLSNLTNDGLPSKSLGEATVVCTSMILYLIRLEKKTDSGIIELDKENEKYNTITSKLWNCRSTWGWGVYLSKESKERCSLANTNWALRALNQYEISSTSEFKNYIRRIYEYNQNGTFGYFLGDTPRLVTTAMYLSLFFELQNELRNEIIKVYDVEKAIDYVYQQFVFKKTQLEIEQLLGIDKNNTGPQKAPWNHVVIGYCMDALSNAYAHGKMGTIQMDFFLDRVKTIIKKHIYHQNPDETMSLSYYMPPKMQQMGPRIFTFPTAYMIWGMSSLKKALGGKP